MTSSAMRKISHFVDCNCATHDPEQLRYLAAHNSYLYFPGLLPVEDVLAARSAVLHIADRQACSEPIKKSVRVFAKRAYIL